MLWVVWDTARADRMSLYGAERETTPFLDAWARDAVVFDDCRSVASSTVPAHGSMFTGVMPSEHGADNRSRHLDDGLETVAEVFHAAGYATYLYSANPNIQRAENFDQGFEVEEHPWDPERRARALEILRAKTAAETRSNLAHRIATGTVEDFDLKACGALANEAFSAFLARDHDRPFFAFLNYMEAHEPLVPPRELRARFLSPEDVERSYAQDRGWRAGWQASYGVRVFPPEWYALHGGVYDAALLELDGLFADLTARLAAAGVADDTLVIVTSDHGEHLGEHGLVGHRYSLYDAVLHVPLVVRVPGRAGGRSGAPVSNVDLFRSVLELAGLLVPAAQGERSHNVFDVPRERVRLAEYPGDFPVYLDAPPPGFDSARWTRRLRAWIEGDRKLIRASDGSRELYSLAGDPAEAHDLSALEPETLERLSAALEAEIRAFRRRAEPAAPPDGELLRQLEAIGY